MQRSEAVAEAMSRVRKAAESLVAAEDVNAQGEAWREFLTLLDRFWNRAEAHFGKSGAWGGWCAPYKRARKDDPLLLYLRRARDNEEHADGDHFQKELGSVTVDSIDPARPSGAGLLRIDKKGEVHVTGGYNMRISRKSARVRPQPVSNRGTTFALPTSHQGERIDPEDILTMAKLGLRYYERFLSEAEARFYK